MRLSFPRYVYRIGEHEIWTLPVGRRKIRRAIKNHPKQEVHFQHFTPAPTPPVGTPPVQRMHRIMFGLWPQLISYGICNCRTIHNSATCSEHACCNAEDLGHGGNHELRDAVAHYLVKHADALHVNYVIKNVGADGIWSRERGWHSFDGYHPDTHVHVDFLPGGCTACHNC